MRLPLHCQILFSCTLQIMGELCQSFFSTIYFPSCSNDCNFRPHAFSSCIHLKNNSIIMIWKDLVIKIFFLAINACPRKDSTLSTFWRTSRIQSRRAVLLGIGDLINVVDTSTIPPIEDVMHNPQNMTTSFTPSKLTMVD